MTLSVSVLIFWCFLGSTSYIQVEAIKFAADGVTSSEDVLRVNEDAELSCKYIMWKQETLASVTWSIQYTGVKTDFFVYRADGRKDVIPGVSLVSVFTDRSNDKSVTLMLTDSREREVSFCCHVMVLRDDGYGSMTTKEKEKCSGRLPVESVRRIQERAAVILECPETASVGQTLQLVCQGTGLSEYQKPSDDSEWTRGCSTQGQMGQTIRVQSHSVRFSLSVKKRQQSTDGVIASSS